MNSISSNDNTADVYDVVYDFYKGEKITSKEIKMIQSIVPSGSQILDIGCGTGRHLIKLSELGYKITGVDNSQGMLNVLKRKLKNVDVFNVSFSNFVGQDRLKKFDLIVLFWNTLNELALGKDELTKFFEGAKKILKTSGKILINVDDVSTFDPGKVHFEHKVQLDGYEYSLEWKVVEFDKTRQVTKALEKITKISLSDHKIARVFETVITQRWWTKKEIVESAFSLFKLSEEYHLPDSEELYLLFELK